MRDVVVIFAAFIAGKLHSIPKHLLKIRVRILPVLMPVLLPVDLDRVIGTH
jgi:hypothetical protein